MFADFGEGGRVECGVLEHPVDCLAWCGAQVLVPDEQCRLPDERIAVDEVEYVAVDRRPVHAEGAGVLAGVPCAADLPYLVGVSHVDEPLVLAEFVVTDGSGRGDPAPVMLVRAGDQLLLFLP